MKHLIILILILFLVIPKSYSQSDFRNGYIIKNNNDTVYGLIDYRGIKANSEKCIYKNDANSEKQEFTPNDIRAYRFIDSKFYISKLVKSGDKQDTLFLEYLINGIVSIYYYRDDLGEHYLLEKSDNTLYELKNEEKAVTIDNSIFTEKSNEYIGILKYSFKDSPSAVQMADKVELNHKSLVDITLAYHKEVCSDKECIVYEKKLPKIITRFGPFVGITSRSISKDSDFAEGLFYLQNSKFEKAYYPSLGFFFKINMPYLNEKLFFQYEGTYSNVDLGTSNAYIQPGSNMVYLNTIQLTQNVFNSSILLRYEFQKGTIRPTLHIGTFLNYAFMVDYSRNLEVQYPSGETFYTEETHESPFTKVDYGLNLGLGVISKVFKNKDIFIDFRYQRGFGLLNHFNTNFLILNFGFQIAP